jgi:hypothetical protein
MRPFPKLDVPLEQLAKVAYQSPVEGSVLTDCSWEV